MGPQDVGLNSTQILKIGSSCKWTTLIIEFSEEYEDPDQVFDLETFDQDYKLIEKKLAARKIYVIN